MELAEEDGIVRIRRRDFTKRRLPMCNSFWRPWNCYCEKFSSCNSSTESPQIGRIQPPYYPAAYSTNTTIGTTPTFLWGMTASVGGDAMVWVSMNFAASKNMRAFVWSGWRISWFDVSQCALLIKWKYVEALPRCCYQTTCLLSFCILPQRHFCFNFLRFSNIYILDFCSSLIFDAC